MATGKRILVLYGSYAIGKSYIAKILLLWNLYLITKIKNLRQAFNKAPTSTIVLQLFSPAKGSVGADDLQEVKEMIMASPYFSSVCPIARISKNSILLKGKIRIDVTSRRGDARSTQLFFASLDEGNFLFEGNRALSFQRATGIYREVYTRIQGRWGMPEEYGIPFFGMIVVMSSADTDDSFVERIIKDGVRTGQVHVERMANYDVDPNVKDQARFPVFVGEGDIPPHIMQDCPDGGDKTHYRNAQVETLINNLMGMSYEEFMRGRSDKMEYPPESLRDHYESDIQDALQSFSGRAVSGSSRLIKNMDIVHKCIHPSLKDPVLGDSIPLLIGDSTNFEDCVDLDILRANYQGGMVFYHIDQSRTTDSTGVCFIEKSEGEPFRVPLAFRVVPSRATPVDLWKVSRVPLFLRDALEWDIMYGTYDQFQSFALIDDLRRIFGKGFRPNGKEFDRVGLNSVEGAYSYLTQVSLLRNNRIQLYYQPTLFEELKYLEHHKSARKVDHPETTESGKVGSKDMADAFIGATQACISFCGLTAHDFDPNAYSVEALKQEESNGYQAILDMLQDERNKIAADRFSNNILATRGINGTQRFNLF